MKTIRVGGPLLGGRSVFSKQLSKRGKSARTQHDLTSWTTFEPIITPPLSSRQERFVLLPSGSFVTVLAYKTGRRVASFVPLMDQDKRKDDVIIESACLASFPASQDTMQNVTDVLRKLKDDTDTSDDEDADKEAVDEGDQHVLLVGCRDGTIREFDLSVLTRQQKGGTAISCGPYDIPGPCHMPRRVFADNGNHSIKHLTVPSDVRLDTGVLLYALSETKGLTAEGGSQPSVSTVNSYLQRIVLPPYDRKKSRDDTVIPLWTRNKSSHVKRQEHLKCHVGYDKDGKYHNNAPFRLVSVSRRAEEQFSSQTGGVEPRDVFVVLARSNTLNVYYERVKSCEPNDRMQSMSFTIASNNPLSAVSVAPNGTDITCGYVDGDMRIMCNALPTILDYFQALDTFKSQRGTKPSHPAKTILSRRVHWHAHPVTSLAYHGVSAAVDPMLYSGGHESVLVTWQLSRGSYKPADVLPRLAKGGIVHICCAEDAPEGGAAGILVYCEDNSLQLFESHNKSLLWKAQGLASFAGDSLGDGHAGVKPLLRADSLSGGNTLILSGLPGAPGYLHWYDTREQRVTAQLEVAPFNRVSTTETDDSPLPVPSVTNCAFSESGHDLVTLDSTPTENGAIGARETLRNGSVVGVVNTLRFWSWSSPLDKGKSASASPYALTASMTYPHGEENRVTAVAITNDGQYACTVSNDENAFRMWHRVFSDTDDEDEDDIDKKSRRRPVWMCRYKVTTPSGYSNFGTSSDGVGFSADGSILAICYGNMITLWDHKESTLLTALHHLEDDHAPVEELSFVKTGFLHDLIMTKSHTGVTLQSPFANGQDSWSCALPANYKDAFVSHAELIPSHDLVAVCIEFHKKSKSHILLLEAATGIPHVQLHDGKARPMIWEVPGGISSLGVQGKSRTSSNWADLNFFQESQYEKKTTPIRVYITMKNGDMLLLQSDGAPYRADASEAPFVGLDQRAKSATDAPRLNMLKRGDDRKRQRKHVSVESDAPPTKRSTFGESLGDDGTDSVALPSTDLPALGGAFTRAFVGRTLAKNKHARNGGDNI